MSSMILWVNLANQKKKTPKRKKRFLIKMTLMVMEMKKRKEVDPRKSKSPWLKNKQTKVKQSSRRKIVVMLTRATCTNESRKFTLSTIAARKPSMKQTNSNASTRLAVRSTMDSFKHWLSRSVGDSSRAHYNHMNKTRQRGSK